MYFVECVVDAYIVVLRHLSGRKLVCSYSFTSVHPWTFKRILLVCSVFNMLSWECLLILSLQLGSLYRTTLFVGSLLVINIFPSFSLCPCQWLIAEAQLCGVELLENILSLCTCHRRHSGGNELIVELAKRLLFVQKDLGLQYVTELSSVVLSMFVILTESELEHEQLSILKIFHFLLKWKCENGTLT